MQAIAIFGLTLALMGAAFAIPASAVRSRAIRDHDTPVLGAVILEFGLGGINLLALAWFAITGEISVSGIGYGTLPLIAGVLGLRTVLRKINGTLRSVHLLIAAVLTLVGFPGYFAPPVAGLVTMIATSLYLGGLIRNPRTLLRTLDPRN